MTPAGTPVGSAPTETRGRPRRLGDEQQRVAAGQAAERAELVAGDEHEPGADPARARARRRASAPSPTCRSGRSRRAWRRSSRAGRRGRHRARPALRARRLRAGRSMPAPPQPLLDRRRAARRSAPSADRPRPGSGIRSILRRLSRCETISACSPRRGERLRRSPRPRRRARRPPRRSPRAGTTSSQAVRVGAEDLGAAVHAQVQPAGPGRPRPELPVDVADVRAGDDAEVEARARTAPRRARAARRVGRAVGHRRPVPVEDDGLEAAIERGRQTPAALLVGLLSSRCCIHRATTTKVVDCR